MWEGMECGNQIHGKAWNVTNICKLQWGLWRKLRLEIETQQLTLNQDKQHEHNLNPTL